ncbi:MAG: TonB-dependent receptor [Bacteroidota bacterium]
MRKAYIIFIFLCILPGMEAQTPVQTIRGIVVDRDSHKSLSGASVTAMAADKKYTAVSDSSGIFIVRNVPAGRVKILCTYIGYAGAVTDDIIINAAREAELTIEMEEERKLQNGVTITAIHNPKIPVNKFALVSGRSFSPEETQRFAASGNDPSRMALGFPGVQANSDVNNDIIIRGNNPAGMQWRLEGVDIVNPNHFARKGSSGGGITIFSLSMLDNSDFLTGAMPAEYGDVLSGVFDIHLRKGNDQKTEYTFKAGLLGLDFSTEGPIKKGRSSYLVNYRYSTLSLLGAIGLNLVGERLRDNFQDLSFNLAFSNKLKTSQWNVWGIGGYSKETELPVKDTVNWKQYDDYAIHDFRTRTGAIGIGNTLTLSDKSFLHSSLVIMGQRITWIDDTLTKKQISSTVNNELYDNDRITFATSFNHKFNALANLKTGFYVSDIIYQFKRNALNFTTLQNETIINGAGNTWLLQPYVQMSIKPGVKWTINPGVNMMHFALNNKTTIDPRLSVQYKINSKQNISLAYGLHSKILPMGYYFYKGAAPDTYPNHDLDMLRAHHYILAFDQLLSKGWRLHTELYYQHLFNVPVVDDPNRTFSMLNEIEGYAKEALVSKGKGTNKGIDVSLEKFFTKGFFMITSFSVYKSTYQPLNGNTYNTRFNAGTAGSWAGAKEWKLKGNKVFQCGWKVIYNGGFRLTPLSSVQSTTREPVEDETMPYTDKINPYFRIDGRLALRKDKQKRSWQLALDIQNLSDVKNTDPLSRRYDPSVNKWIFTTQSGIVPVLSYQIDF